MWRPMMLCLSDSVVLFPCLTTSSATILKVYKILPGTQIKNIVKIIPLRLATAITVAGSISSTCFLALSKCDRVHSDKPPLRHTSTVHFYMTLYVMFMFFLATL